MHYVIHVFAEHRGRSDQRVSDIMENRFESALAVRLWNSVVPIVVNENKRKRCRELDFFICVVLSLGDFDGPPEELRKGQERERERCNQI